MVVILYSKLGINREIIQLKRVSKKGGNVARVQHFFTDELKKNKNINHSSSGVNNDDVHALPNFLNDLSNVDIKQGECSYDAETDVCFTDPEHINKIKNAANIDTQDELNIEEAKLALKCGTQKCVAEKSDINDVDLFKPDGPTDTTLLSNVDIEKVLKQYEKKYTYFKSFGFTMDNWNATVTAFNNDVKQLGEDPSIICSLLGNAKTCIGFIMNTDTWSGGGLHWTACFIDLRCTTRWQVEFFNSSSNKPSRDITNLMNKIVDNLYMCNSRHENTVIEFINVVKKEQQKTDTECGAYCLYYIYNRCKGVSHRYFEYVAYDRVLDETVNEFRKHIFWTES